jgi:hypothetical protein
MKVTLVVLAVVALVVMAGAVASPEFRLWLGKPMATDWLNVILVAVLLLVTARYADTTDKLLAAQAAERRGPISELLLYIEEQLDEAEREVGGARFGTLIDKSGKISERFLDQFRGETGDLRPARLTELMEEIRPRSPLLARSLKRLSGSLSGADTHLHNFRNDNEGSLERLRTEIKEAREHLAECRRHLERV